MAPEFRGPFSAAALPLFLRLGATGFGGPVALANAMRRDLVEERRWVTESEYDDGLAIAAACPGPLAYQLGVYCGYIRFGVTGGLAAAVAFGAAPFAIVVIVLLPKLPEPLLVGVGAVIGLIAYPLHLPSWVMG